MISWIALPECGAYVVRFLGSQNYTEKAAFLHNFFTNQLYHETMRLQDNFMVKKKEVNEMSKTFKLWTGVGVLIVVALVVGLVGSAAFADSPKNGGGNADRWGVGHFQGRHFGGPGVAACGEAVSELLGLSPEEIREQRLEGMSLVEIAAAQGVDEQTLTDTVLAEAEEALQQRADAKMERLQENISDMLNRTDVGPFGGKPGIGAGNPGQGFGPDHMGQMGPRGGCGYGPK